MKSRVGNRRVCDNCDNDEGSYFVENIGYRVLEDVILKSKVVKI